MFTLIGALLYTYHLYWTIFGVDQYCDITRTHVCGEEGKNLYEQFKLSEGMTAEQIAALDGFPDAPQDAADASSKVFDGAIAVVTVFHMIEWLRQTVFLTSALVNVNLMPLYYALSINVPFGFIAMIIGIAVRSSADGKDCA